MRRLSTLLRTPIHSTTMAQHNSSEHFPDPDDPYLCIDSSDSVVHLEYTPDTLPSLQAVAEAHGGGQWTRFVCLSDTHGTTDLYVPEGDVLLHSGDLTETGRQEEMERTMEWVRGMPHKVKMYAFFQTV